MGVVLRLGSIRCMTRWMDRRPYGRLIREIDRQKDIDRDTDILDRYLDRQS